MVSKTHELDLTRVLLVIACFLGTLTAGCGSASQSVTGPSSSKCAVAAAADTASFPPGGGNGHISVTTNRECQWTASASSGWIQLSGTANGQGEARIPFTVAANGDPSVRRGAVTVADQQINITQEAAACQLVVTPTSASVPAAGGRGSVQVTASSPLCTWTARSEAAWLSIREGAQGTGNGQVVFDADGTAGPPRTGTLTIAGQTVTVTQGDGCGTSISSAAQTVGASGGSGSISVTTGAGCGWSARSDAPWISISAGHEGAGPGTVTFTVPAWNGPSRTGTLQVAGHIFTVTQADGCSFQVTPASAAIGAAGGTATAQVQAAAGCGWTASSAAPWVAITAGASGSGSGEVRFTVSANAGPERSGTLTLAGRSVTITQASGCSVSIAPGNQTFPKEGGSGSISVTVGGGCPWTASTAAPWVHITSGASGTGPGTVTFAVNDNDGAARQATIQVGSQVFSVQQEAGCTYGLSASSADVEASGGGGTVMVNAGGGCTWSASSGQPWIRITGGHTGRGTEPVSFTVDAHDGPAREGVLTIAGLSFTVRQASGCRLSIDPAGQAFGSGGGSGTITVGTGGGCPWNAASDVGWVTVLDGNDRSGPGTVTFSVQPNPGEARTGRVTVGGLLFVVTQSGQ